MDENDFDLTEPVSLAWFIFSILSVLSVIGLTIWAVLVVVEFALNP